MKRKTWKVFDRLFVLGNKDNIRRKARGVKNGTCLADCLALIAKPKSVSNHHEFIVRYYKGKGDKIANLASSIEQVQAYFRKRGFRVVQSDKAGAASPQWSILCGYTGNGKHAIIVKGKKVWLNPATFDCTLGQIKYAEDFLWIARLPRKKSRDIGQIVRR